jgi:hypothetical protein
VPGALDYTYINNGGEAQATTADAITGRLYVGASGPTSGIIAGTVTTSGFDVGGNFSAYIGSANDDVTSATGVIGTIAGNLDMAGGTLVVGSVGNSTTVGQATATGTVNVDGFVAASQFSRIGYLFSGDGVANGSVTASDGVNGTFGVGVAFNGAVTGQANGSLTVTGGDLTFNSGKFTVGDNFGDATAIGNVDVQAGIIRTASGSSSFLPDIIVGKAFGGNATGDMRSLGIDTTSRSLDDVIVGLASSGGTAIGTFEPGAGNISMEGNFQVGQVFLAGGGDATGSATIGGIVTGVGPDPKKFEIGTGLGTGLFDLGEGVAVGGASVDGVAGFDINRIGVMIGTVQQATASVTGTLNVGADGIAGKIDDTGRLDIGVVFGTPNNNSLSGPGGNATGAVTVTGGDVGHFDDGILVGHSSNFGNSDGTLIISDGNLSAGGLSVGTTLAQNVQSVSAPDAVATATGSFTMSNGMLTLDKPFFVNNLDIGAARVRGSAVGSAVLTNVDASVAGSVNVGHGLFSDGPTPVSGIGSLTMTNGSFDANQLNIGFASTGDNGQGEVSFDGTTVSVTTHVIVGSSSGHGMLSAVNSGITIGEDLYVQNFGSISDPGTGTATFTNSSLNVGGSVVIGPVYPGGAGSLSLVNSTMNVGGILRVGQSSNAQTLFGDSALHVDRSHVDVAEDMILDIGASLEFVLGGTARGTDYGAIDALSAVLDGDLVVSFEFLPIIAPFDFDLIVTELSDGITGDFLSLSILGLSPMFYATAGIVTHDFGNGAVEVYRLTIHEASEPGVLAIFVLGLVGLGLMRRRRRAA